MLDTGIDVPEVVNLVFFKLVRSKTKFWQMVGRGTRLCKDLFGPGQHKTCFYIFDYCQNLEFFSVNPETTDGSAGDSLAKRLFTKRVELIDTIDHQCPGVEAGGEKDLRHETTELLRTEVSAMNLDNFVVRPKRKLVEKYNSLDSWKLLTHEAIDELTCQLAGLPTELPTEPEEAKRFDLLMLRLQLAVLRADPGFARVRDQVKTIAGLLEEKASIPMVNEQMALILEIQTDEWWQHVTAPILENARKRLRLLVQFIERRQREPIYTDFEDVMGAESVVSLPGFAGAGEFERFREKARAFLRTHQDHVTIHKLRTNQQLTATDLAELERMLAENGVGNADDIERAKSEANGLGLFVRSLVGLDREAAKQALARFLAGQTLTANQIEFVDMIINHLTEHGSMEAGLLYDSPFTDVTPRGPEGLFTSEQVGELIGVLQQLNTTAIAA